MGNNLDNVRSRKWQLTVNNPLEKGLDHTSIKDKLNELKSLVYWCMCDEEGDECETLHTHIYICLSHACTASRLQNLFPDVHREIVHGKSAENRAYILKDGDKYNKDHDCHYSYTDSRDKLHEGINFSDTFEEDGEMPQEHQGKSTSADIVVEMIRSGASNSEIVDAVASAYRDLEKIERVRSMYRDAEFANKWRDLEVTYIFGDTGTGKTRSVMDKFGYAACYRVTDYHHPFDTYDGQDVIIFEEFRGGIKHGDMLNYLDGYPLLLPCRYFNRQACYTKVFIITNIPPEEQYVRVDKESREAFYRRIHKIVHHDGERVREYAGYKAWKERYAWADEAEQQQIDGSWDSFVRNHKFPQWE